MKNLIFLLFALLVSLPQSHATSAYIKLGGDTPNVRVLTSFTPSVTDTTNLTRTANWYKNADGQMVITYRLKWTGANGGGGGNLGVDLPTGYTFNQSRYLGTFDAVQLTTEKFPYVGTWEHVGDNTKPLTFFPADTNTFNMEAHYGPVLAEVSTSSGDLIEATLAVWVVGPGF
jgi:hypothetical protein